MALLLEYAAILTKERMGQLVEIYSPDQYKITRGAVVPKATEEAKFNISIEMASADGNPPYGFWWEVTYCPGYQCDEFRASCGGGLMGQGYVTVAAATKAASDFIASLVFTEDTEIIDRLYPPLED